MKQLLPVVYLLIFCITASLNAQDAKQQNIALQSATIDGDLGLFTVPGADTLAKGQYSIGAAWNNADRTPGDVQISGFRIRTYGTLQGKVFTEVPDVLDITTFPIHFAYGVSSRFTLAGTFQSQERVIIREIASNRGRIHHAGGGIGDTTLSAKYRIRQGNNGARAIALKGSVKLPTGDPSVTFDAGPDVGADLAFTTPAPAKFTVHADLGYTLTGKVTVHSGSDRSHAKDEARAGFGAAWPAMGFALGSQRALQAIAEFAAVTYVGAGTRSKTFQPNSIHLLPGHYVNDFAAGMRFMDLGARLTVDVAYRNNLKFGATSGQVENLYLNGHGWVFSITYTRPGKSVR